MQYTNILNTVWNNKHNGTRVPVNDTGVNGSPVSLFGNNPDWIEGSINKAVISTYLLTGTFPSSYVLKLENLSLDLGELILFTNPSLLYGYVKDAKDKKPQDMMSFRGYPTGTLVSTSLSIVYPSVSFYMDVNGAKQYSTDRNLIAAYTVTLNAPLPYDILLKINSAIFSTQGNVLYKIAAGSTKLTHFNDILSTSFDLVYSGSSLWKSLKNNSIYLSLVTTGLTGNLPLNVSVMDWEPKPQYDMNKIASLVVLESVYNVDVILAELIPNVYFKELVNINHITTQCSEILESDLGVLTPVYKNIGELLSLGSVLYQDNMRVTPVVGGFYYITTFVRTEISLGDIYRYIDLYKVDLNGVIIQIYENILWTSGCYGHPELYPVIIPDTTAPSNPTNLVALFIGETTFKLNWDASTDNKAIKDYTVYKQNSSTLVFEFYARTTNTYLDISNLLPGTSNVWGVAAMDTSHNFSSIVELYVLQAGNSI